MKKILFCAICLVMALCCLVGCGSGDVAGKYECAEYNDGKTTYTDVAKGIPIHAFFRMEIKEDGKAVFYSFSGKEEMDKEEFEWKKDGDKIIFTQPDKKNSEEEEGTIDGDTLTLTITEDGITQKAVLKKVDSFSKYDIQEIMKSVAEAAKAED